MLRLFLPPEQFANGEARIVGTDHQHLARVLRARVGDAVMLLDNAGNAFCATLVRIDKSETIARLEEPVSLASEPPTHITVAQALNKGDKFEQVIQHGTEAGASAFVPVRAARCVADVPANRVAERVARWQQIAKGAAEQSERSRIPGVSAPLTFAAMLETVAETRAPALLLHPDTESVTLADALRDFAVPPSALWLLVGPEGGWSPSEVASARASGCITVRLGPRILRTETAALVAISQILFTMENL